MTDLVDSLRDSLHARADSLDVVGLAPAPLIGRAARRQRRQRLMGVTAALAGLVVATATAGFALQNRMTAGPPATQERVPSGIPLAAVGTPDGQAALWAACSDPGGSTCDYTAAMTTNGWDTATVLGFSSTPLPRLVALRSGGIAVLAGGQRGWILSDGAEAQPLAFHPAPLDPSSTLTLIAAPPGTPSSTKDALTQPEIAAGKDTNQVIWAIDEATLVLAPLNMQPGSPARLGAEPVRAGVVTYAALRYPAGATIDVMAVADDGGRLGDPSVNVGYVRGKPRWPSALGVGSDGTIVVTLSAPAVADEVWVLRGRGHGTWTRLTRLPYKDMENLAVTDDGSVVVLDADSHRTTTYDSQNQVTPTGDTPLLLTLGRDSGLLTGVTESGAVATSRDGHNWAAVRPDRAAQ